MGRSADRYWDVAEARWVRSPRSAHADADADAEADGGLPSQRTAVDEAEEADVRSR